MKSGARVGKLRKDRTMARHHFIFPQYKEIHEITDDQFVKIFFNRVGMVSLLCACYKRMVYRDNCIKIICMQGRFQQTRRFILIVIRLINTNHHMSGVFATFRKYIKHFPCSFRVIETGILEK